MAIEKLNLRADSQDERFEQLKQLYPELFSDGNLNVEALKEACGLETEEDGYYGLYWPGKNEAKRLARKEATGTLEPVEGDGVNEETTHNIYIEGDNLEVLRTLKKSYQNRVKMIYIDPPYNTGNDFIYPDNYQEPVEDYLRFTGQMDDEGTMLVANPKSSGKFHRRWLNMMYPRLQLARELLTDDGVIFISIDENEFGNLRLICDEIFGEANYFGDLVWEATTQPINAGKAKFGLQKKTEIILMYANNKERKNTFNLKCLGGDFNYPHQGKYGPCRFEVIEKSDAGDYKRNTMKFKILGQSPRPGKRWQIGEDTARELEAAGKVEIVDGIVKKAIYPEDEEDKVKFEPFWSLFGAKDYGTAETGKAELTSTLGTPVGFDTVKPIKLIAKLISYIDKDSIILDFFSGSATTAHAVMQLNKEDNGNRKFIMVQLPQKCDENSEAAKAGYPNICEIGKERIRRAGKVIIENGKGKVDNGELKSEKGELRMDNEDLFSLNSQSSTVNSQFSTVNSQSSTINSHLSTIDVGFKVYRLAKSNFTEFENVSGTDRSALEDLFAQAEKEPLTEGWRERKSSVITELCLRHGFVLDSAITKCTEYTQNEVLKVVDQDEEKTMFVCLDEKISEETAKTLHLDDGEKFICLDSAIDDQLKLQLSDKGRIETI